MTIARRIRRRYATLLTSISRAQLESYLNELIRAVLREDRKGRRSNRCREGAPPKSTSERARRSSRYQEEAEWDDYPDAQELPGGINNPNNWDSYRGNKP